MLPTGLEKDELDQLTLASVWDVEHLRSDKGAEGGPVIGVKALLQDEEASSSCRVSVVIHQPKEEHRQEAWS